MSNDKKTEIPVVTILPKKADSQFFQHFRQSASQQGQSRYWRLLAQRGWRPAKDEAIKILAHVKSKKEKYVAAQALFILTGDRRLLDGASSTLQRSLERSAASLEASSPAGSRTEATIVFMRHHLGAFASFIEAYCEKGPLGHDSEYDWQQLSQSPILPNDEDRLTAISELRETIQPSKQLSFFSSSRLDSQVYFHPLKNSFFIAENLLTKEKERELFHKMLYQWLIFQDELWFCNFLSLRQMTEILRQAANEKLSLCLLPDWFPRCQEERDSFPNSTQFEFLQSHRNPFLLTLADLRSFKKHWQQNILDRQVKLTQDIIGLAQAVLGTDLRTSDATTEQVPVPVPLRNLLQSASRLYFHDLESLEQVS